MDGDAKVSGRNGSAYEGSGDDDDEDDERVASLDGLKRTLLAFLRRLADGHGISDAERKRACQALRGHSHLWSALLDMQRYEVSESMSELAEDVLQLAL